MPERYVPLVLPPCKPIPWKCGHVARFAEPDREAFIRERICPVCSHGSQEAYAEQRQMEEAAREEKARTDRAFFLELLLARRRRHSQRA